MKKTVFLLLYLVVVTGCKTIYVNQEAQKTVQEHMSLGIIGEKNGFVLEQSYHHIGLPKYETPIKVQVTPISFNKLSFKAFEKAKQSQNTSIKIDYIDSLDIKPQFLKLDIADRVAVINSLNSQVNNDILLFLKNQNEAHMVTTLSVVFNNETMDILKNAEEVILEQAGVKNYVLKTYQDGLGQHTIHFKEGVAFAYKTSNACWQENDRRQLKIADIVSFGNKCPKDTYRIAKRAKKKVNYFKL